MRDVFYRADLMHACMYNIELCPQIHIIHYLGV